MFEADSFEPIFGKNGVEHVEEKRKREESYMKHQLEAAAGHKRKAILNQLLDQEWDLQMLKRTQKEWETPDISSSSYIPGTLCIFLQR